MLTSVPRAALSFKTMAKVEKDQVIVRPVTHADCDAIRGIIRNYADGNDRFLYHFHKDLNLPTTFPYLVEIAGEIVAYTCGQVIEDGEMMLMREGRVSEKYQKRAVINKLNSLLIRAAVAKFPNVQRLTWLSRNESASQESMRRHPYMKLILHCKAELFQIHPGTLKALFESDLFHQFEKKYPVNAVTAIPKLEALRLLTEEIRFLDYAPQRPIIGSQPSGWHSSTLATVLQVTNLFITRSSPGCKIEAFSLYTTFGNDIGARIEIITYCAPGNGSADLVIAHLLHILQEIATIYTNEPYVVCTFMYPSHIDGKAVPNVLKGKLGTPLNEKKGITANMLEYKLSDVAAMKSKL